MKPPPIPLDLFYDHPVVQRLTSAHFGAYARLVLAFWNTGMDIPKTDGGLAIETKTHLTCWHRIKMPVRHALEVTMPEIKREYLKRMAARLSKSRHICEVVRKNKLKRHKAMSDRNLDVAAMPHQPLKAPLHIDPRNDMRKVREIRDLVRRQKRDGVRFLTERSAKTPNIDYGDAETESTYCGDYVKSPQVSDIIE